MEPFELGDGWSDGELVDGDETNDCSFANSGAEGDVVATITGVTGGVNKTEDVGVVGIGAAVIVGVAVVGVVISADRSPPNGVEALSSCPDLAFFCFSNRSLAWRSAIFFWSAANSSSFAAEGGAFTVVAPLLATFEKTELVLGAVSDFC